MRSALFSSSKAVYFVFALSLISAVFGVGPVYAQMHASSTLARPSSGHENRLLHSVDFMSPEDALRTLGVSENLAQASFRFVADGSSCSAAFVSDRGHVLTAGHCFSDCLMRAKAYSDHGRSLKINPLAARGIVCPIEFNGQKFRARLLSARHCGHLISRTSGPLNPATYGCNGDLDYALFAVMDGELPVEACFKTAGRAPRIGDSVAVLGFPRSTYRKVLRPEAKDAENGLKKGTVGQVVNQTTCTLREPPQTVIDLRNQKISFKNYLEISADVALGSSGAPVVNTKGEVVGVFAKIIGDYDENMFECPGSSLATPMTQILEAMRDDFLGDDPRLVMRCETKAIQSQQP